MAVVYGEFVRRVRESRGMSQETLADVAGISQPNISAYERGRRVPSGDTLNKILVACGYELAATDGRCTIFCPLPRAGWFPDEDVPAPEPDDPGDQPATITAATPMRVRAQAVLAVLELADTTR